MATIYYHTVDGQILGETSNGVRRDYLTDALGSVTATVDQSAQIENTYRYKPYGATLAKVGAGVDPRFRWNGRWGNRDSDRSHSEVYVRARNYSATNGIWTSKDVYWPRLRPYN